MSDPQRNSIVELGLDPEEVQHLVERANAALGAPVAMQVVYSSKKSQFGFYTSKAYSPDKVLKTITKGIERETGMTEADAIGYACDVLEKISEVGESQGPEAARQYINHQADPYYVEEKILEWERNGKKKGQTPIFEGWQVQTPIGTAIKYTTEKAISLHKEKQLKAAQELRKQELAIKTKAFGESLKSSRADFMAQAQMVQLKARLTRFSIEVDRKKMESVAAMNKTKFLSEKLDRSLARHAKAIENRSHQSRFKNFWESEEGKRRRDEIIKQGAVMSLAARRLKGFTKSEVPTKMDVLAAKKAYENMLRQGKTSREAGVKAIHDSRIYGVTDHLRKKNPGASFKDLYDKSKPIPSIKKCYADATGFSMSAEQAQKIVLTENQKKLSSLITERDMGKWAKTAEVLDRKSIERAANEPIDLEKNPHVVTREDGKKAQEATSRMEKGAVERAVFGEIDLQRPENRKVVSSTDFVKVSKAQDKLDKFRYVKTTKPMTQDLDDQKKPEKVKADEALSRAEKKAQGDRRFEDQVQREIIEMQADKKIKKEMPIDEKRYREAEMRRLQEEEMEKRLERLRRQAEEQKYDPKK